MTGIEAQRLFAESARTANHDEGEIRSLWRSWLEDRWGWTRAQWMLREHEVLSEEVASQVRTDSALLASGMPYQFVVGRVVFAGFELEVGPGVLIPRPETEAWARSWSSRLPVHGRGVDVCAGSGCIARALAESRPDATIFAVESVEEAWHWLVRNTETQSNIHRLRADALALPPEELQSLDLLLSNPPYIPDSESTTLAKTVRDFEPGSALFVPDADPLLFYRSLVHWGERMLRPGGWWSVECHTDFTDAVADLVRRPGWSQPEIQSDIFGKPRFVEAQWLGIFTP